MINQTGIKNYFIRGNKDRKLLVNNLKYLCQRIYLTYCPDQKHDNANDIIKNFLETINSDFRENQLSFLPGIYGMLPAYNKLQDINYWQSEDINEYMALSKIKDIAKYFNIQIKPWSEYELKNKDYSIFSKAILQFLNDEGFNNGRIKIIIKLNKLNPITGTIYQRNIRVKFFPDERIIEYTIPIRYHSQWIKKLGLSPVTVNKSLLENFILEDELMKSNNILDSQPSVYDIDFKEYKEKAEYEGFSYQHAAYKKLAETIFVGTIKHSIYLNHNISLVYIFSNNAVFKNKNEQKDTRRDVGLGGLFLVLDKELVEKKDNIAIKYFSRISDTLANRIVNFYQVSKVKSHALQSAVAQIFARNFAHNIGSHVAIRATSKMAKERIANLYHLKKSNGEIDYEKFNEKGIINWLDYMGEKLDLFEVARNEFLADYKLPPKNVMFYRNVILPFCENTLLMDNIAHSEGIGYKIGETCCNSLKIKVYINNREEDIKAIYTNLIGVDNNNEICYPDEFPYLFKTKPIKIENEPPKQLTLEEAITTKNLTKEDIEICLASEHSLYSILENFIRNSAKHNKSQLENKELIINLEITDTGDDDYYTLKIFDNISAITGDELQGFQKKIEDSLITSDGEIKKENLGIADLKINAHLLRSQTEINNENLKKALNIIFRKEYDENKSIQNSVRYEKLDKQFNDFCIYDSDNDLILDKKVYNFGYELKLCKPKKIIWIGKELNEEQNKELKNNGIITYASIEDFTNKTTFNKDVPLANYEFAILELSDELKNIENTSPNYVWDNVLITLPHRVLLNASENEIKKDSVIYKLINDKRIQQIKDKIKIETIAKDREKSNEWDFIFLKRCWEEWLKGWDINKDNKAILIVYLEDKTFADKWRSQNLVVADDIVKIISIDNQTNIEELKLKLDTIDIKNRIVIFDHHGDGYGKILSSIKEKINFINKDSYFQFDKSSDDYIKFSFPVEDNNKKKLFVYEAIEAGLNRILIADERIAEMLNYNDNNIESKILGVKCFKSTIYKSKDRLTATYADLANNGNVFIATKIGNESIYNKYENVTLDINKNEVILPFTREVSNGQIINSRITIVENNDLQYDCLIIHRTFLVKIFDFYKKHKSQEEVMHNLYCKFRKVIIISGGGYPHSFQLKNINFKTYSQLKSNFVKYPSKISLAKII